MLMLRVAKADLLASAWQKRREGARVAALDQLTSRGCEPGRPELAESTASLQRSLPVATGGQYAGLSERGATVGT